MLDIPITERDREILMAFGKIKRQKQRPSVDRLYNICHKSNLFKEFSTKEKIQSILDDMIERQLLVRVENPGRGLISYREINSAIPIVAINNPIKSRVHLIDASSPPLVKCAQTMTTEEDKNLVDLFKTSFDEKNSTPKDAKCNDCIAFLCYLTVFNLFS